MNFEGLQELYPNTDWFEMKKRSNKIIKDFYILTNEIINLYLFKNFYQNKNESLKKIKLRSLVSIPID